MDVVRDESTQEGTVTALLAREEAASPTAAYTLTVVEGADRGASLVIDGTQPSRVLVGQSPVSNLRLTDRRVSRRHLGLDAAGDGLRVTDLSSTNGTFVDGVRIFDALLQGGELVRLGDTALRVDASGARAAQPLSSADRYGRLVGTSVEMRRLYPLLEGLAHSSVPVIIEGETGTGKEVLAEALHESGDRATGPFVVFDCTAVPPNLLESELFGHERGAFTGAVSTRHGVFEQANKGTLLIDEIGDLDLALQPKLLRALERSEVRRVGGSQWIKVDVRVLAATRRDLDREVQEGRFRDDLFFRLAVARIELPPLRRRKGDIAFLTRHLWGALGGVGEPPYEVLRRFERYAWHGNVRELGNAVARHLALGDQGDPAPAMAGSLHGDPVEDVLALDLAYPRARDRVLAEFEKRYVARVLARHGGNVTRAAEASGIGRRYFTTLAGRATKG